MDNKTVKTLLGLLGFVVLSAGIFAGVYLVSSNQDIREKAAPATTLSLFPASQNKSAGETFSLTVKANSGENKITGIDIELSFNPATVKLDQMTATSSISNLSTVIRNGEINNTTGKARFVAFTASKDKAISGSLDILSVTGTILSGATEGATEIGFTQTSTVAAVDEGVNVIINSVPATINVQTGSGSNSVSPTTTATATATSTTSTKTATPTAVATLASGGIGNISTATPTVKPTSTVKTATSTPMPIPVTGASSPQIFALSFGAFAILFALVLAL